MKKFLRFFSLIVLVSGIYLIYGLFNSKPPSPTLTIENKHVTTAQASYCWNGLLKAECVDTISPPEIIKHQGLKPVVVTPEAKLKIEFKNEPIKNTLSANKWKNNKESASVNIDDHVLTAPKEKGIYIYDLFARWEKGDASYAFVIEVE